MTIYVIVDGYFGGKLRIASQKTMDDVYRGTLSQLIDVYKVDGCDGCKSVFVVRPQDWYGDAEVSCVCLGDHVFPTREAAEAVRDTCTCDIGDLTITEVEVE